MPEVVDHLAGETRASDVARTLLLPYLNHAATMYASDYATAADIDAAMRFGCGYPVGPLSLIDTLGARTVVDGLRSLHDRTGDPLHAPAKVLVEQADTGTTFADAAGATAGAEPQLRHDISQVGVVGTGTMAAGIVQVFAQSGFEVVFVGRSQEKLDGVVGGIAKALDKAISKGKLEEADKEATLARLTGALSREALHECDIVVEAIAEDIQIKEELFADLDRICKDDAILATTTSSLSINDCAAATGRGESVIGMHFFNPAPVMKLVEVVTGDQTSPEVDETVQALCLATKKHPVSCSDRAGFIVNCLLFPYLNDAVQLHERDGDSLDDINAAMKEAGLPLGPFQLLDVVGNDVSLAIQRSLVETFGHDGWEPAKTLIQVVEAGKFGRKTGAGFHDYS